jgi:hypothetical protein
METPNEKRLLQREGCPFARLDESSQIIRRKDLVSLGDSFRASMIPFDTLARHVQRQVILVNRLQYGLFALFVVSIALLVSTLWLIHRVETRAVPPSSTTSRPLETA